MINPPSRIPLSPSDYLVFSHHHLMRRKLQGEYLALMMLDVEGHVEPDRVRNALTAAMTAHPTTLADICIPLLHGKPCWRIPARLDEAAGRAAGRAHTVDDLRDRADWAERLELLINERLAHRWSLTAGPPIRLDQYALPDGRTRFCLRWPHCLMDAEGAQLFLREIGRFDGHAAGCNGRTEDIPPDLLHDHQTIDVLRGRSLRERVRLLRRALAAERVGDRMSIRSLQPRLHPPTSAHGLLHRCWLPEKVQRVRANAQADVPAGPALYTRYFAVCAIRALHRIYREHGVDTDAYVLTLPIRVTMPGAVSGEVFARPVCGNYLVAPILYGRRSQADDKHALGEELLLQFETFTKNRSDLSFWAMMWAASHLRVSTYQLLFDLRAGFVPLASGFSCYGEIERPVRSFAGAAVTNLWGAGLIATPPGWNLVFSRFQDRLNVSLTYNLPTVSADLARRYLDYIEAEVFARE